MNDLDFVSINYPYNRKDTIKVVEGKYSIDTYIEYINEHALEKADVIMPDLAFLKYCPTLKYLRIQPSCNATKNFDFSPLYDIPGLKYLNCQNKYGSKYQYTSEIDYSLLQGLISAHICVNKGTLNYNKVKTLKTLSIGEFKGYNRDLTDLFSSDTIDTLFLNQCGVRTLDGIECAKNIQCLYLQRNNTLKNIEQLSACRNTLRALRISNCSQIQDFSVLEDMHNLQLLELTGKNQIPDLYFINKLKNLKTLILGVDVLNGDLMPCLNLSYVYVSKDRKHNNLMNIDLPKGEYVRGNESIETWRRFE